jgi:hypothetical protein
MTTLKQQLAIQKTVENGGNVTQAMREVGYAETTIHNPSNLTTSKAYREMFYASGLTEELVTTALVEDIREKKGRRISELLLAAELLGMRKIGVTIANQVIVEEKSLIPKEHQIDVDLEELTQRMVEEIKQRRMSN